jgi:hypothetical protein
MTTKILTILIAAAVLAGSAAAALQATDASLASTAVCQAHPSVAGSATSGRALVFVVAPPAERFAASARGPTQPLPRIVVLTPRASSAAD